MPLTGCRTTFTLDRPLAKSAQTRALSSVDQDLARGNDGYAEQALNSLAGVFTDRQQYPKAADCWRQSIKRFGNGQWKTQQLHQILLPEVVIEPAEI